MEVAAFISLDVGPFSAAVRGADGCREVRTVQLHHQTAVTARTKFI